MDLKKIQRRLGVGGPLKPSESIGKVQARDSERQSRSGDDEEEFEALQRDRDSDVQQRERADEVSPRPEGQSDYDRATFLVGQFHGAWNRSGGTLNDSDFLNTLSDKDREAVTSYTSIGHDYGPPGQSAHSGRAAQTRGQSDLEGLSPPVPDSVKMQDVGPEMDGSLDGLAQDDRRREARAGYESAVERYRDDEFGGLYQEMASKGIRTERKPPVDEEERIEDSRQRRMAAAAAESEPAQTFKQYIPEIQAEQSESFKPYDLETPGQAEQSESFKPYTPETQAREDAAAQSELEPFTPERPDSPYRAEELTDRQARLQVAIDAKGRTCTAPGPAHTAGRSGRCAGR